MKTEQPIRDRLNKAQEHYQIICGDTIDPVLEERIRELRWVLDD